MMVRMGHRITLTIGLKYIMQQTHRETSLRKFLIFRKSNSLTNDFSLCNSIIEWCPAFVPISICSQYVSYQQLYLLSLQKELNGKRNFVVSRTLSDTCIFRDEDHCSQYTHFRKNQHIQRCKMYTASWRWRLLTNNNKSNKFDKICVVRYWIYALNSQFPNK